MIFGNLNISISNNIDIKIAENNLLSESLYTSMKILYIKYKSFYNGLIQGIMKILDFTKHPEMVWFFFGLKSIPLFSSFHRLI